MTATFWNLDKKCLSCVGGEGRTGKIHYFIQHRERADCKSRDPPPAGQKDEDHGQLVAKSSHYGCYENTGVRWKHGTVMIGIKLKFKCDVKPKKMLRFFSVF